MATDMNKIISRIVESQSAPVVNSKRLRESVENQPTVGVDARTKLSQCGECHGVYQGEPEKCPICGADASRSKLVVESKGRSSKVRECDDTEDKDDKKKLTEGLMKKDVFVEAIYKCLVDLNKATNSMTEDEYIDKGAEVEDKIIKDWYTYVKHGLSKKATYEDWASLFDGYDNQRPDRNRAKQLADAFISRTDSQFNEALDTKINMDDDDDDKVVVERRGRKVRECDDTDTEDVEVELKEAKVPDEVDDEADEALVLLDQNKIEKFNERFGTAKMSKAGKLQVIVESANGRIYAVERKMNATQRATFRVVEAARRVKSKASNVARIREAQVARLTAMIKNEAKSSRVAVSRYLERCGVPFDATKVKEITDDLTTKHEDELEKRVEAVLTDIVAGTDSTPEGVAEDITKSIEDTGLEVVTQEVTPEADGSTTVQVRIQDDPAVEVNLQDIADTVSDVIDKDVAVVGPTPVAGDSTLVDVAVVVDPDPETIEETETVALSESLKSKVRRKVRECDDPETKVLVKEEDTEDKPPKLTERRRRKVRECDDEDKVKVVVDEALDDDKKKDDDDDTDKKVERRRRVREYDDEAVRRELDSEYDALDAEEDALR